MRIKRFREFLPVLRYTHMKILHGVFDGIQKIVKSLSFLVNRVAKKKKHDLHMIAPV
jgi:hypothetical protein